jgi:hypothetical protein
MKMMRKQTKLTVRLVRGGKSLGKRKNDVREVAVRDHPSCQRSGTTSKSIARSMRSAGPARGVVAQRCMRSRPARSCPEAVADRRASDRSLIRQAPYIYTRQDL